MSTIVFIFDSAPKLVHHFDLSPIVFLYSKWTWVLVSSISQHGHVSWQKLIWILRLQLSMLLYVESILLYFFFLSNWKENNNSFSCYFHFLRVETHTVELPQQQKFYTAGLYTILIDQRNSKGGHFGPADQICHHVSFGHAQQTTYNTACLLNIELQCTWWNMEPKKEV